MSATTCVWSHTEWTPYEVLQVAPSASISEIRIAFRRMALHTHPDKAAAVSASPTISFHAVKEASEVLLDPYLRAAYDAARSHALVREVGAVSDTYSLADDFVRVEEADGELLAGGQGAVHVYRCECRCGGVYEVVLFPEDSSVGAAPSYAPRTLRCECDSCSLVVEVVVAAG